MKIPRRLAAIAMSVVLSTLSLPATVAASDLTKVTFSLDFIPLGRHAPWYAALEQGFFRDEGLDVTIIPSRGSAAVVQAIEADLAQIGFVDVPGLALARANGSTLKMLTVNYQKAPYAIFTLENGANVTEISQLEGLTLGSGVGSFTPKIIRGLMKQNGLNPESLEIVNVAPPARGSMLLTGQVPAIEFFVMAQPGLSGGAASAATELKTFLLGDHGLELYSNGIATTEAYLAENPDVVRGFVKAALKGWQFALANPEQAADDQLKHIDSLKRDVIIAEIGVVANLAITDDTTANGLGWFDPQKMQSTLDFVIAYVGIEGDVPAASDLFDAGYLPADPIKP